MVRQVRHHCAPASMVCVEQATQSFEARDAAMQAEHNGDDANSRVKQPLLEHTFAHHLGENRHRGSARHAP